MSEDIFVPQSSAEDALVGPLHTVTYVTADKAGVETIFREGYGLDATSWFQPSPEEFATLNAYFGIPASITWEACSFYRIGVGQNVQVRVLYVHQDTPQVRPTYEGLYTGGATISFPIVDLRAHEKIMAGIGVESTMGVKEMEFTSPAGETYISAEVVYKAPDNVFVMGVTRPDIFVPVGPIDPAAGMGGPAYSARCITATDATIAFLADVMGYEIRRDTNFEVGERSAINLPEGTTERFIQAFAPGSGTGYVVLMDHGDTTKRSPAPHFGPPNRGIGMWTFSCRSVDEVYERARTLDAEIVVPPTGMDSPFLDATRTMLLKDPDGFLIEIFES